MKSSSRLLGSPTSGFATPSGPFGSTLAETALRPSVIRVTSAVPFVTSVTRPASPSPVTTGSLIFPPELEPLSMVAVEYQTLGERAITRAVRGVYPARVPPLSRPRSLRSCVFWPSAPWALASSLRSCWFSAFRSELVPRALKVSLNQLIRSRAGLSARVAPSSIGPKTDATARCAECRGPLSRSEIWVESNTSAPMTRSTKTARRRLSCLRYTTLPGADQAAAVRVPAHSVDGLELLERAARAHRHAGERRLGELRRHLTLLAKALIHALKQGPATGERDSAVHDVAGELRRGAVQGVLDRGHDLVDRLLEGRAHLARCQHDRLRQTGDHVATPDLGGHLLRQRSGRADLELHLLGRLLADEELVLVLAVVDDRLVLLVAANADRLGDHDPPEGDHGDLAGATADVQDHAAGGLADRQPRADRRRHRLLDQVGLAGGGAGGGGPPPR